MQSISHISSEKQPGTGRKYTTCSSNRFGVTRIREIKSTGNQREKTLKLYLLMVKHQSEEKIVQTLKLL